MVPAAGIFFPTATPSEISRTSSRTGLEVYSVLYKEVDREEDTVPSDFMRVFQFLYDISIVILGWAYGRCHLIKTGM